MVVYCGIGKKNVVKRKIPAYLRIHGGPVLVNNVSEAIGIARRVLDRFALKSLDATPVRAKQLIPVKNKSAAVSKVVDVPSKKAYKLVAGFCNFPNVSHCVLPAKFFGVPNFSTQDWGDLMNLKRPDEDFPFLIVVPNLFNYRNATSVAHGAIFRYPF